MKEEPPGKGGEKRGPGVADSAKEQPPCAGLISVWALGGLDLVDSQQEAAIENCVVPSSPGEGPLRLEAASQGSVGAVRGPRPFAWCKTRGPNALTQRVNRVE